MNLMYLFFGMGVLLLIGEILTPGTFIFFSIGIGAIITSFFTLITQNISFLILFNSIISFLVFIIISKKNIFKVKNNYKSNKDMYTGKEVEVLKKNENNSYRVKIFGEEWTGISELDFNVGEIAIVEKMEGSKLILIKKGE